MTMIAAIFALILFLVLTYWLTLSHKIKNKKVENATMILIFILMFIVWWFW